MPFLTTEGNSILNLMLRKVSYTPADALYLSLHTGDPGQNGANEVTGGSYARKAITFDAASSKKCVSSAAIEFEGMPSATVSHVCLWDNSTSGNVKWAGSLAASKAVPAGETLRFKAGEVTVELDPA